VEGSAPAKRLKNTAVDKEFLLMHGGHMNYVFLLLHKFFSKPQVVHPCSAEIMVEALNPGFITLASVD